jgi:hypothetical protein
VLRSVIFVDFVAREVLEVEQNIYVDFSKDQLSANQRCFAGSHRFRHPAVRQELCELMVKSDKLSDKTTVMMLSLMAASGDRNECMSMRVRKCATVPTVQVCCSHPCFGASAAT